MRDQVVVDVEPGSFLAERYPDGSFTITIDGGARDARVGDDGPLFLDGRSRGLRYLTVITEPLAGALTITADLLPDASPTADADLVRDEVSDPAAFWDELSSGLRLGGAGDEAVRRLDSSLDWMVRDALVHYLSPRGLSSTPAAAGARVTSARVPSSCCWRWERTDACARAPASSSWGRSLPDGELAAVVRASSSRGRPLSVTPHRTAT